MRKLIGTFSLILAGLFTSQIAKADVCNSTVGNLVTNCGFETGDFTGWSGTTLSDGYSAVSSYTNTGLPGGTTLPYSGGFFASLGAIGSTSTLSQTIATTAGLYDVSFALANDTTGSKPPAYANSFQAVFGGVTLLNESAVVQGGYTLYNYLVVASGTSTTLSFTQENDAGDFGLDSVSVSQAPEPSSLILLGTGALGLMGVARRRLKI